MPVLRPISVLLQPTSCNQSDASGALTPKLNAQRKLARQRGMSQRGACDMGTPFPAVSDLEDYNRHGRCAKSPLTTHPMQLAGSEPPTPILCLAFCPVVAQAEPRRSA